METLIPEVQREIEKIAKDHGFKNFTITITNTAANETDGYIGVIEAGCIKDKNSDKTISLVIKKAPLSINFRKQFPLREAFEREIYIYEKVFPEFLSFQTIHNVAKVFNNFPKVYGCIGDEYKETLIMENLKEAGFKLTDRTKPLDGNHLNLVLKTYAKLHAISYGMKKLEPEKFKLLTERINTNIMMGHGGHNRNEEVNGTLFKSCFSAIRDRPDLISELKKYEQSAAHNFFLYITQLYKDQYAVFTHSDCWSANLLFKYGDESKPYLPTDISIIDWQTSAVSHPVHDISYFFFITAGKADLHNYKSYLRSYYEALCENLSDFGIEAKSFYPFELLEEHWKKYSIIGFIMCLVMLKQSLSSTKTRDLPKMADNGESLYNLGGTDDDSQLYEQRMTDLVEFLIENKLIQ